MSRKPLLHVIHMQRAKRLPVPVKMAVSDVKNVKKHVLLRQSRLQISVHMLIMKNVPIVVHVRKYAQEILFSEGKEKSFQFEGSFLSQPSWRDK